MSDTSAKDEPQAQHVTVDGIEGRYARIELPDGSTEDWLVSTLPRGVKEGDVLTVHENGGDFDLELDHAETHRRREKAEARLEALNTDAPAGEINL